MQHYSQPAALCLPIISLNALCIEHALNDGLSPGNQGINRPRRITRKTCITAWRLLCNDLWVWRDESVVTATVTMHHAQHARQSDL
jgi:hypothetical protein